MIWWLFLSVLWVVLAVWVWVIVWAGAIADQEQRGRLARLDQSGRAGESRDLHQR